MANDPKSAPLLPLATEAFQSIYDQGFKAGAEAILKVLREDPARLGVQPVEHAGPFPIGPMIAALRSKARAPSFTGEAPTRKAGRTRRMQRLVRDEELARELAALIQSGETTESARAKMGIGIVRSQRVRAVAVKLGYLKPRQRNQAVP